MTHTDENARKQYCPVAVSLTDIVPGVEFLTLGVARRSRCELFTFRDYPQFMGNGVFASEQPHPDIKINKYVTLVDLTEIGVITESSGNWAPYVTIKNGATERQMMMRWMCDERHATTASMKSAMMLYWLYQDEFSREPGILQSVNAA